MITATRYSHIINGYIGSKSFLTKLGEVVRRLKEVLSPTLNLFLLFFPSPFFSIFFLYFLYSVQVNPGLRYVCDPVMGDIGPGLYVPK